MDFDINDTFSGWDTMDSLAILFFMLIAFLFGFIAAYLLRSVKIRKLQKELKAKKELSDKELELANLQEIVDLKEADLKKTNYELQELQAKLVRIDGERGEWNLQRNDLKKEIERLETSNQAYINTIEDLNEQINAIKAEKDILEEEVDVEEEEINSLAQMQSVYNATRQRLKALEDKLSDIEGVNKNLRVELDELKEGGVAVVSSRGLGPDEPLVIDGIGADDNVVVTEKEEEEEPEFISPVDKSVMGKKILLEEPDHKDDLTRIEGIGPFLEKQLNEIDIYTYEEIAAWTPEQIEEVTEAIGYFSGRIEKDNWVGQAAELMQQEDTSTESEPGNLFPSDHNDLKVVEGIGPRIEQIFKEAGIHTWEELGNTTADQLRVILDEAGDHFKVHDPTTWPNQARLACNGEWELLKEYKDELKGGKEEK